MRIFTALFLLGTAHHLVALEQAENQEDLVLIPCPENVQPIMVEMPTIVHVKPEEELRAHITKVEQELRDHITKLEATMLQNAQQQTKFVEEVRSQIAKRDAPSSRKPSQTASSKRKMTPRVSTIETPPDQKKLSASSDEQKTNPAENSPSHFEVGANYTWAHIHPHGLDSSSGSLGGLQALYEYRAPKRIYGAATLSWRQGETKDGNDRSLAYIDTQERLGYTFGTWHNWFSFTLFSGFGYRHYGEKVSLAGDNVTFNYNEFYIPFGFLSSNRVNSYFTFGLNFQWMPQVYPTVTIAPLKGARWILTTKTANFRIDVPLTFSASDRYCWAIVLEPFFEYWKDGKTTAKTEIGTALDVPGNTYLFVGANLNFRVSF